MAVTSSRPNHRSPRRPLARLLPGAIVAALLLTVLPGAATATAGGAAGPVARPVAGAVDPSQPAGRYRAVEPPLRSLSAAVLARSLRPARLAFLGSSTTAGAGVQDPAQAFVALVLAGLRAEHPTPGDSSAPPESLYSPGRLLSADPGLAALNGGIPGATAQDYLPRRALWGIRRARPACVVHMVGSNDSLTAVTADSYAGAVRGAISRIDAVAPSTRPCHVLVHSVRRQGVSPARWAELGAALREVAERSDRVTFLDVAPAFEAQDALGSDPADLISSDRVHPSASGHALIASLLLDHLDTGIGTRAQLRRLDSDGDGVRDRHEVRRGTDPARRPGER